MDRLAKVKEMTRSELIRDALRRYQKVEEDWRELVDYGQGKAAQMGIRTAENIERLIDDSRK